MDLTERVIGTLILLYDKPLSRIVCLTVDDILTDSEGRLLIRLGDTPAPIPSPFDGIVHSHLSSRHNMHTATNPNSSWLFPGRRAGQPPTPHFDSATTNHPGHPEHAGSFPHSARNAPPSTTCGRGRQAITPVRPSTFRRTK